MNIHYVLVTGGRGYRNSRWLYHSLDTILLACEGKGQTMIVIHGGASGADSLAHDWCLARQIPEFKFPARWNKYAKPGADRYKNPAGPIRNREMRDWLILQRQGRQLEQLMEITIIGFPDPGKENKGTHDMMSIAKEAGFDVIDAEEARREMEALERTEKEQTQ